MAEYIPSPRDWVREQVELYERTNGAEGNTLRDTGLPVIIVTHVGNKTGAIRKTPLMRVKDGANYVLVGSMGEHPRIRFGFTTCVPIRKWSFAIWRWCGRCGCARSPTRRSASACGRPPMRPIRGSRSIELERPG
jgi:hypothetical protein